MNLRLNRAVRLLPPAPGVESRWIAEDLLERRRYRISVEAAAALVAAGRERDRDGLVRDLSAHKGTGRSAESWAGLVATLCRVGLLVDPVEETADPRVEWLVGMRARWSRYGWHEAVDYHAISFDYPCVDYSDLAAATEVDQGRMRRYQNLEPDDARYKLDYVDRPGVPLPPPTADLTTGTADEVWVHPRPGAVLSHDAFLTLLSLGFGVTGTRIPRTDSAPLLLRTSPSGGGRNPSEGYVVVLDVPEIDPGWYHVTLRPFSLRALDGGPTDSPGVARLLPDSVARFPFDTRAAVIVTSVFERNMYRYREPRTFRTVHMDAGHIAGSLSLAARSLGLTAGVYYSDDALGVEKVLGLDGMSEGYMLTVALADGTGV
jgi:SagB-type dehydrogenase family enzyme